MKSERVNQYLSKHCKGSSRDMSKHMHEDQIMEVIELAEQDARERAMKAFCRCCAPTVKGRCLSTVSATCENKYYFIKEYDDE